VRAKRTLAETRVPFEVPRKDELAARLASVLEVVYLVFNEGYSATAAKIGCGPRSARRRCVWAASSPSSHPRAGGPRIVALMEIQASRAAARIGPSGEPILLLDQDRSRWDHLPCVAVSRRWRAPSSSAGGWTLRAAGRDRRLPRALAHCGGDRLGAHRGALRRARADRAVTVVELNRAVAVAMAFGPAEGLALVDALASEQALKHYHLLPAVRATSS